MIEKVNILAQNDFEATKNLLNQFREAMGIVKGGKVNTLDFLNWLENRQVIGEDYLKFLSSFDLNFDESSCVEVGKTACDSLVLPYRTGIITSYTEGFGAKFSKVIPGKFKVTSGLPFLTKKDEKRLIIPNILVNKYMTQNPYSRECISNWENLHNSGIARIIVGVYGNTFDKDKKEKLKQLKLLKDKLTSEFIIEYDELSDKYYSVVASSLFKTKCKIKEFDGLYDEKNFN